MIDVIQHFVDYMGQSGCAPANSADIHPTGEDEYFTIEGDKRQKRGGYCLTIESDGFAHGNFINFKTGEKGSWHSASANKQISEEERLTIKQRIEAANKARKDAQDKLHADKAKDARLLWETLKPCVTHPYIERKGIQSFNARIDGKDLILPMYATDGKIHAYQRINEDGDKYYLKDARKNGLYCPLAVGTPVKQQVILCEGFATGASLRMALPDVPVIVCFDAYNLLYVAQAIRTKYKAARIIIAGDNDESETGQKRASQAAAKVKGFAVWPDLLDKDFNDIHKEHGLDAIRIKLAAVQAPLSAQAVESGNQAPPLEPPPGLDPSIPSYEPDDLIPFSAQTQHLSPAFDDKKLMNTLIWKKYPTELDDGKLEPNSIHNILVFLRHKSKYSGLFRHDRFAQRVILHKCPFWEEPRDFKVRRRLDTDVSYLKAAMERDRLSPGANTIREAIDVVAKENWINPPLEFFESLKWDGVCRLKVWLRNYLSAEDDEEYLSSIGVAWLVAGVARIYSPGCKAENMLVLEGGQGALKSTVLSTLANFGEGSDKESYFCDTLSFADVRSKDTILKLQGKLIVEFPELAKLDYKEVEEVKAWMSIQEDEMRKPYGHDTEKYPRQFILAGTTNNSHWLKDDTGNRRFWPVKCGIIDITSLRRDREQLWAEAVNIYKNQGQWWIGRDSNIWVKAEIEQDARLLEDIWANPVEAYIDGRDFVTIAEILKYIGIDVKDHNRGNQGRVITILKRNKYIQKQGRVNGKNSKGWGKPVDKKIKDADYEEIAID